MSEAKKVWRYKSLEDGDDSEAVYLDLKVETTPTIGEVPGRWLPESEYQELVKGNEDMLRETFHKGQNSPCSGEDKPCGACEDIFQDFLQQRKKR